MAYSASRLTRLNVMDGKVGLSLWHYLTDGTDTVATVVTSGYFNNAADMLRVGDRIMITVPGTQTAVGAYGLKQVVDVGQAIVVSNTGSVVNLSNDIEAATVTYT